MALDFRSRPSKNERYDPEDEHVRQLPGDKESKGNRRGQEYKFTSPSANLAQWDDECNYDPGLANLTPMDGVEYAAYRLCNLDKGVSVDNVVTQQYAYKPGRS